MSAVVIILLVLLVPLTWLAVCETMHWPLLPARAMVYVAEKLWKVKR